jgi:hypothetical protein
MLGHPCVYYCHEACQVIMPVFGICHFLRQLVSWVTQIGCLCRKGAQSSLAKIQSKEEELSHLWDELLHVVAQ